AASFPCPRTGFPQNGLSGGSRCRKFKIWKSGNQENFIFPHQEFPSSNLNIYQGHRHENRAGKEKSICVAD
ncbi:MAG: hypothetical protein NTV89_14525, partial [Proteobacteria bacterium]|nr:hypothetical protein [Pseudomonadota bacterium]